LRRYTAAGAWRFVFVMDGEVLVTEEAVEPGGRGLHSLPSELNLRTFGKYRSR
jgi:hypothetical protein